MNPKIERLATGLINTSGYRWTHNGLWSKCKTRKPFQCQIGFLDFPKGTMAYRPFGNGRYRMHRIAVQSIERVDQASSEENSR